MKYAIFQVIEKDIDLAGLFCFLQKMEDKKLKGVLGGTEKKTPLCLCFSENEIPELANTLSLAQEYGVQYQVMFFSSEPTVYVYLKAPAIKPSDKS